MLSCSICQILSVFLCLNQRHHLRKATVAVFTADYTHRHRVQRQKEINSGIKPVEKSDGDVLMIRTANDPSQLTLSYIWRFLPFNTVFAFPRSEFNPRFWNSTVFQKMSSSLIYTFSRASSELNLVLAL